MKYNKISGQLRQRRPASPKRGERVEAGLTLVEMMIVISLLSLVMIASYELISSINVSSENLQATSFMTEWGQKTIDQINLEVTQSRMVYENNSLGIDYHTGLQLDASYPVLTGTLLPQIDQTGTFRLDTTVSRTGNALLFIQEMNPFSTTVGGALRRLNVYRLVYYYLSPNNTSFAGRPSSLRLIRWQSKEFADYEQIMAMSAVISRATMADALYSQRGITYFWLPRNTPDTAFYEYDTDDIDDADDDNIDDAPNNLYVVQRDNSYSIIGYLGFGTSSVAWNKTADFPVPVAVPKFGIADQAGAGFPHGFEVQIIGPTGARQVMVRLVIAYFTPTNKALYGWESSTIAVMHEF
ncbi:MAG: prepilin-type N-terminal cleavage/methylation domain-containing protein [Planctomycetes bacterium]|nr:prepilin-type N-terminal cleavage/methylation domain-containing protein [Planctomycetota bacterium]